MELRHLRYFLAVAENCHFRNAAEELLVSQPTLSQQVKDLELELGISLFERVGRRVRLTQAGVTYRDYARRALNVLEEGQAALREFDTLLRGNLTVGVVQTVNTALIPGMIAEFVREIPNVLLCIKELSADEIEEGVLSGSLDLGISFYPTRARDFAITSLFQEEFVLLTSQFEPQEIPTQLKIAELAELPLALLNRSYCTRRLIDRAFQEANVPCKVVVELNSVSGLISLVESGGPATILPGLVAQSTHAATIPLEPALMREVTMICATGHAPMRARDAFMERFQQHVESRLN